MSYELMWLRAFAVTIAIEAPIYVALFRRRAPPGLPLPWGPALALAVALQAVTHPALWFVAARWLYFEPYWAWVLVMEVGVVLVEGGLVAAAVAAHGGRPTWRRALAFGLVAALIANAVSTLIGLVLFA